MEIKQIERKHLSDLKSMRKYCFSVSDESAERSYKDKFTPENYIGYFENDTLTASVEICPYTVLFNGHRIGMGGFAWVASFPEFRYGGRIRKTMGHSLSLLRERGMICSFLGPFSYSFYRNLGWGSCFTSYAHTVKIKDLPSRSFFHHRAVRFEPSMIHDVNAFYKKTLAEYNGPAIRSDDAFLDKMSGKHVYVFYDDQDQLCAYMIYTITGHTFVIDECITASNRVLHDIFLFIRKHDAQADTVKFHTTNEDVIHLFDEHHQNTHEIRTQMMARIVDVKRILLLIKPDPDLKLQFRLRIFDHLAEWNNHGFEVTIDRGRVHVEQNDKEPFHIAMDIDRFSQLAMGVTDATGACEAGWCKLGEPFDAHLLNGYFSRKKRALYDSF